MAFRVPIYERRAQALASESGAATAECPEFDTKKPGADLARQERESRSAADGIDPRVAELHAARGLGNVSGGGRIVQKARTVGRCEPGLAAADTWKRWGNSTGVRGGGRAR